VGLPLIEQPPYAPELNPAERVFEELRAGIEGVIYPTIEAKVAAVEAILDELDADPERVKRLTSWGWIVEPSTTSLRIMRHDHTGSVLGCAHTANSFEPGGIVRAASPRSLTLPLAAFGSIRVAESRPVNAVQADTLTFREKHWWSYVRLGFGTGYYQSAAGYVPGTQDEVVVSWLGSAYRNAKAAESALYDGIARTRGAGSAPACGDTGNWVCLEVLQTFTAGKITGHDDYVAAQVRNCDGEFSVLELPDGANPRIVGALRGLERGLVASATNLLANSCPGQANAPAPLRHLPPLQPGFKGECWAFRGKMWTDAQLLSLLLGVWWSDLQKDYGGNYPPPSGGSVPGITDAQFQAARKDVALVQRTIYDRRHHKGLAVLAGTDARAFGVTSPERPGPANWAVLKLFTTYAALIDAAHDEWLRTGTGLPSYHVAQQQMGFTWEALKQLPCE
jgi:hypothetical protein